MVETQFFCAKIFNAITYFFTDLQLFRLDMYLLQQSVSSIQTGHSYLVTENIILEALIIAEPGYFITVFDWVSDCCLTSREQLITYYIMSKTSYFRWWMSLLCTSPTVTHWLNFYGARSLERQFITETHVTPLCHIILTHIIQDFSLTP